MTGSDFRRRTSVVGIGCFFPTVRENLFVRSGDVIHKTFSHFNHFNPTSRPGRYEGPALGLYNISKVLPWVPLPQKVTARRLPGPFRSARWW